MKARLESAHRPQVQRQEIKKQCPVRFRGQRHHLALLVLPGMVIHPLQVGGFSAQTWTVVHQLVVNFARGEIDKRHCSSIRIRPNACSPSCTAASLRASISLRFSSLQFCRYTHSFREFPPNPTLYFQPMPPVGNVTHRNHTPRLSFRGPTRVPGGLRKIGKSRLEEG